MSMYKCPVCGELFSTSYKKCPFCEEDDLLMDRRKTSSRRSRRNEPRAVGPLLIVIFLLLVALVVFLVAGDSIFGGKDKVEEKDPPVIEQPIENEDPVVEEPEPAPVPESLPLALDKTSAALNGGETLTLTASEGSGSYTWTSSDEAVAKVADGVVTAVGGGSAVITVSDGETELSCTVTVTVQFVELTLKQSDVSINAGESFKLKYEGGTSFTFTSDNESVAVVSEDGVVTGKVKGKANITVSNGSDTKSCIVRVRQ